MIILRYFLKELCNDLCGKLGQFKIERMCTRKCLEMYVDRGGGLSPLLDPLEKLFAPPNFLPLLPFPGTKKTPPPSSTISPQTFPQVCCCCSLGDLLQELVLAPGRSWGGELLIYGAQMGNCRQIAKFG